jgi:hypothetical protein
VSVGPDPQLHRAALEQTRKQVNRLFEEVGRLTELDIKPNEFYGEFLTRVLAGLMAPAGAVWVCTSQGNLQMQHQINLRQIGLDASEGGKQGHDELLRHALRGARPLLVPPHSGTGNPEGGAAAAANPSDYLVLLAPVVVDDQVAALVEIWQFPDRHPDAAGGFLKFLTDMARLASIYTRNFQRRQMTGQQQLWVQLETFARKIHATLNPTEVAYIVANEGRRLIDCDRVSVALSQGRRTRIEAISGADVVEKRSNLVRLMRRLCNRVAGWGEKLIYTGSKDDSLPPDVLEALDAYLAESNSKLLAVVPLRDERETNTSKRPRSTLLMECFDPAAAPEQLLARLDVIGQHGTTALYNAVEYRRIPFRFVWKPMATLQEGLGGKARLIMASVLAGVAALAVVMTLVPYPLKMEAQGRLEPQTHIWGYAVQQGTIKRFNVRPGDVVAEGHHLALLYDPELKKDLTQLDIDIKVADRMVAELKKGGGGPPAGNLANFLKELEENAKRDAKSKEREELMRHTNSVHGDPGYFRLLAPSFPPDAGLSEEQRRWTVLSADFLENMTNRGVKPSDQILHLGAKEGPWEVELKIPQKHYGQVAEAFLRQKADGEKVEELDVDLLVKSDPTHTYKGKLKRSAISGEAVSHKDENNESEPVVTARVRISGKDIAESDQIPPELLFTGVEVKAKIRCGNRAMGYSLFYGVYEFLYEKVVFYIT